MNVTELQGIPGTEAILKGHVSEDNESRGLKTDGDIILVPQPSDSINDPLNWSWQRRWWNAFLVLVIVGLTAATSNAASAAQQGIIDEYGFSWDLFNNGAGVLFIAIGYWTLIAGPSVYLYGNRLNYLIGLVYGIIGNAWYAKVKTGADCVWSQLFVGASESVGEAVAQLSLSQVFFQHKLGHALGLYVIATSVGTFLGPFIGGFAADNLGWPWVGWLGLIISAGMFVVVLLGLEETYFDRQAYLPQKHNVVTILDNVKSEPKLSGDLDPMTSSRRYEIDPMRSTVRRVSDESVGRDRGANEKPTSYWKRMALITPASNLKGTGFKQYLHRLWLQMRVFTFPAVIYSGFQWGFQSAWLTFYITTESDTWTSPPYNYDDAADAIMNIPTLIGSVIGCLWGSYFSDWLVILLAKRNHGIKEAESRLYPMVLAGILSPLGMFLFGFGTDREWDWRIPYVGLGFIGFGFGCCGDLSLSYLADCYPDMILEGMIGVAVINNTLGMAFSFACDGWLNAGTTQAYIAIGVVDFVVIALTLPMIIWGKRFRAWTTTMYVNFIRDRDGLQ